MSNEGSKKRQTRAKILEVSSQFFLDKGFRETLIIDIAKEVGLDRRTIYRYYPSKEHILMQITSKHFSNFATDFESHRFPAGLNGYEKIKDIFGKYFELLQKSPDMIIFLGMVDINVGTTMYQRDDYQMLDQYGKRLDAVFEELIEEGQRDGSVNDLFEPKEYALTINNSLIALATRISIYRPNVLRDTSGYSWKLLMNQGKILIDSMEKKHD